MEYIGVYSLLRELLVNLYYLISNFKFLIFNQSLNYKFNKNFELKNKNFP
jgi:hypothetical protein